jgi:hypothetical protein
MVLGSSQSPPSAGTAAVTIDDLKFVPASLNIHPFMHGTLLVK